jgi:hypothetical protein
MPDQHIDIGRDITDADTGAVILSHETAQRAREEWTAQHPPVPGLRWVVSFNLHGQVRDRHLEVVPGWEDAYAPSVDTRPAPPQRGDASVDPAEANRLGALAYQGWFAALPQVVRAASTATWSDLPPAFRGPLRQAAALVWQHAENAGFHQALLRTLPAGQLSAAGALEDLADFIGALAKLHSGHLDVPTVLIEIRQRVAQLRRDAENGARRAREQS